MTQNNFIFSSFPAELFNDMRVRAKKMGRSFIEYVMGTSIYNIIDAENFDLILNDQNLITKGLVYGFLHPALRTGLLTSTGRLHCAVKPITYWK